MTPVIVGRTLWSARVPLDPFFAARLTASAGNPAKGPAADQGVRPTSRR
jgi:hypothetical protein